MNKTDLHKKLFSLQDLKYRDMQVKIIPSIVPESVIGVRTPELRAMAKDILKTGDYKEFLKELPHPYFEDNQLQAFIISGIKDPNECLEELERFLPYVDNWATCDQMSPKIFKKHKDALLPHVKEWIKSEKTYTVRFGVGMLMEHFLDDAFDPNYPAMVAEIRSEEYYVKMMIAWYFATALAKQYDNILPYIEQKRLDDWTHNKAIQKSVESRRITEEQKIYLKSLKTVREKETRFLMDYRKLTSCEIEALWALQKQYKKEIGEDEPKDECKVRLSDAIDKGTISFYGVWNESTLIGCCSITVGFSTFDYNPSGVFEDFYIHPEYRHQGIARQLVEYAYHESGVCSLTVGCADCDVQMYQSLGFAVPLGNLLAFE